jgi:hypothetical protein
VSEKRSSHNRWKGTLLKQCERAITPTHSVRLVQAPASSLSQVHEPTHQETHIASVWRRRACRRAWPASLPAPEMNTSTRMHTKGTAMAAGALALSSATGKLGRSQGTPQSSRLSAPLSGFLVPSIAQHGPLMCVLWQPASISVTTTSHVRATRPPSSPLPRRCLNSVSPEPPQILERRPQCQEQQRQPAATRVCSLWRQCGLCQCFPQPGGGEPP